MNVDVERRIASRKASQRHTFLLSRIRARDRTKPVLSCDRYNELHLRIEMHHA